MGTVFCHNCGAHFLSDHTGRCPNCAAPDPTVVDDQTILDKKTNPGTDTSPGTDAGSTDAVVGEAETPPEKLDILLEYQHEVLKCTEHGCIPLRLTNTGDRIITKIHFKARCDAFSHYTPPEPFSVYLTKGASTRWISMDFSIGPVPGPYLVTIEGAFVDDHNNPQAFRGVFKIIVRKPLSPRGKLTIEDGHGIDISNNIDLEAVDVIIKDASGIDLSMSANLEKGWLAIRLEADFDTNGLLKEWISRERTTRRHRLHPLQPVSEQGQPCDRAILRINGPMGEKSIMIWTNRECSLGRSPAKADIVCILMPGDQENNRKSQGISRKHCYLTVVGQMVSVTDANSTCGTFVDNQRIDNLHVLNSGEIIGLGNLLALQYQDFRRLSGTREVNAALDGCRNVFDCTNALSTLNLDRLKQNAPLESFRLRRVNNYQDRLEYLFLLTSATIGASSRCAVRLDDRTVADQHARLVIAERSFHLIDLNSPAGTRVNGHRLEPYMACPLGRAATIHIGDVSMRFSVSA